MKDKVKKLCLKYSWRLFWDGDFNFKVSKDKTIIYVSNYKGPQTLKVRTFKDENLGDHTVEAEDTLKKLEELMQ